MFYIIDITTLYLVNLLSIASMLSKMKSESLNLGPKLCYWSFFRLTFEKKTNVTFEAFSNFSKRKVSLKSKNP